MKRIKKQINIDDVPVFMRDIIQDAEENFTACMFQIRSDECGDWLLEGVSLDRVDCEEYKSTADKLWERSIE